MTGQLAFALQHYALLGLFTLAALGLGRTVLAGLAETQRLPGDILVPLELASGSGVFMVLLFIAGCLHGLAPPVTLLVTLTGLILAVRPWFFRHGESLKNTEARLPITAGSWAWWILLAAVSLPLLVKPLQAPVDWDELAYHLPQARFWAEQGGLAVNEWLRYPLLPFNMHLLYAAGLPFGDEVLAHLLHAWTAAVALIMTFGLARRYFGRPVAALAAIMLLLATRWGWSTANVDFGVMLFWTSAFGALALRHETGNPRLGLLAAALAGLAVGVKYQALLFLPAFLVLAVWVERRAEERVRATLLFCAVGGYWYWRNFLVSGDPLHPLAGHWLGHWLWNDADLAGLRWDLRRVRDWPEWFLFFAASAPLFWRGMDGVQKAAVLAAAAAVLTWALVSGYPRYLVGVYPLLAVLSAYCCIEGLRRSGVSARLAAWFKRPARRTAGLAALVLAAGAAVAWDVVQNWGQVMPPGEARENVLAHRFRGYGLLRLAEHLPPGVIYQLGFEGELYHLRRPVRGDWFGPGRYADVMALAGDAPALARHLDDLGCDGLLVNLGREPFASLAWDPGLPELFERIAQTDHAVLYWRRPVPR